MDRDALTRCWAEIDLRALRENARVVRHRAGGADLCAVIKANAYGHGLGEIARALVDDAQLFGVANLAEAIEARAHAPSRPVLILGPALPAERRPIVEHGFIAAVSGFEEAVAFSAVAGSAPALLNVVIDTGMGRMGCAESAAAETIKSIAALERVKLHSVSTHLPVADEDAQFTRDQLARFSKTAAALRRELPGDYKLHALLSAGVLAFAETPFDIVRAGLALYGISPLAEFQRLLRPVMSLKSRVVLVRDVPAGSTISYGRTFTTPARMRVATIAAGYADGYPRSLSNRGAHVLIRGARCAVLGRVTMDMLVVDVSSIPHVEAGDEVVLIGSQASEQILASDVAQWAGTIAWEIFTGIGTRVRRVYS